MAAGPVRAQSSSAVSNTSVTGTVSLLSLSLSLSYLTAPCLCIPPGSSKNDMRSLVAVPFLCSRLR